VQAEAEPLLHFICIFAHAAFSQKMQHAQKYNASFRSPSVTMKAYFIFKLNLQKTLSLNF